VGPLAGRQKVQTITVNVIVRTWEALMPNKGIKEVAADDAKQEQMREETGGTSQRSG